MAKKPTDEKTTPKTETQEADGPEFGLQRIFLKDTSFETPNSPLIFQESWEPEVNIDLQTKSDKVLDNVYEVVLTVTVTAKLKEKTAFVAEVQQAGIFTIKNFPKDQLNQLLGSVCPGIIFPYARETVSDIVTRGSFPQLLMAPVNFDALYQQQLAAKANAANEKGESTGDAAGESAVQ